MSVIAAELGMSVMTVSNALNGRGRVAEETMRRVLAAAAELGFRKDHYASNNASKRAKTQRRLLFAFNAKREVEASSEAIPLYRDIYFQLLSRLRENGGELVLTTDDDACPTPELAIADAVVDFRPPSPQALSLSKSPRVCAFFESPACWSVQPDNEAVGLQAATLLLKQRGYERLAVCSSATSFDQSQRRASFLRHCRELAPETQVEHLDISCKPLPELLRDLLDRPAATRPEALFMLWGAGVMEAQKFFAETGVSIPKDLNLLGFDDYPFYNWLPFNVSRYYFDTGEVATAIANALEAAARGAAPMKIITPMHYRDGDTLPPRHQIEGD